MIFFVILSTFSKLRPSKQSFPRNGSLLCPICDCEETTDSQKTTYYSIFSINVRFGPKLSTMSLSAVTILNLAQAFLFLSSSFYAICKYMPICHGQFNLGFLFVFTLLLCCKLYFRVLNKVCIFKHKIR